jgi:hypothetical protein
MKRLTRMLGIALSLALVMLAVPAVSSAQTSWVVEEEYLSGSKQINATLAGTGATLSTKIGGSEVEFNCTKSVPVGMNLESTGRLKGKIKFSGCTTKVGGVTTPGCEPKNKGTEAGVILTNEVKGELREHSSGEWLLPVESLVKEKVAEEIQPVFAHIEAAGECAIGTNIPIIGPRLSLVDTKGMGEWSGSKEGVLHEQKVHKVKEGPLTELWALSKTEEHKATVVGEASAELTSGEVWAGAMSYPEEPTWMVKGANLTSGSKSIEGSLASSAILQTVIAGIKFEMTCPKAQLIGASFEKEGKISGTQIKLEECTTKLNGTPSPACTPNDSGTEPGVVKTNPLKGQIRRHLSGENIVRMESTVEETVGGVKQPVFLRLKLSSECFIGSNIPMIGPRLTLISAEGMSEFLSEKLAHTFKVGPLTRVWMLSKTPEHSVTLSAEAKVSLVTDEVWSGLS